MSASAPSNNYQHPHHPHHPPYTNVQSEIVPYQHNDQERIKYILDIFLQNFGEGMRQNPKGYRGRFRKMVANEFAFYRGSAVLFYRDLHSTLSQDRWVSHCKKASNIFIHGDLHAENFGTYIDRLGIINFDVNDFDEGYMGPFTWDVKRLIASINLIAYSKAFSDKKIEKIIICLLRSYLAEIYLYCNSPEQRYVPLSSENTRGAVNLLLKKSRLGSKEDHLDTMTYINDYERRFIRSAINTEIDDVLRHQLLLAFQEYVKTIPASKKDSTWSCQVKDIIARLSPGIGSAGTISYNILIRGKTEALESDTVIFMKPAKQSAVASVLSTPELEKYFKHNGLRTVLCAYAMHAVTTKWLGYATLDNKIDLFVDEVATHNLDLEWDDINDFESMCETAEYLGKAMAKIHCIADIDSIDSYKNVEQHLCSIPFEIIPRHSEFTIRDAIGGRDEEFINDMLGFAMTYGNIVRRDHGLFFEAYRNEAIPIIDEYAGEAEDHPAPALPQNRH